MTGMLYQEMSKMKIIKAILAFLMLIGCGRDDNMSPSEKYNQRFKEYQEARQKRLAKQQAIRKELRDDMFEDPDYEDEYDELSVEEWYEIIEEKQELTEKLFEIEGCNLSGPLKEDYTPNKNFKEAWKRYHNC